MGVKFALDIARKVTAAVLRYSGLTPPTPFASLMNSGLRRGRAVALLYNDDINVVGASAKATNAALDHAASSFAKVELPTQPSEKKVNGGRSKFFNRHSACVVR